MLIQKLRLQRGWSQQLWTHPQYLWVGWEAMGWGIGLLFHGLRVIERFSPLGADWEKKRVEKRLGRKI